MKIKYNYGQSSDNFNTVFQNHTSKTNCRTSRSFYCKQTGHLLLLFSYSLIQSLWNLCWQGKKLLQPLLKQILHKSSTVSLTMFSILLSLYCLSCLDSYFVSLFYFCLRKNLKQQKTRMRKRIIPIMEQTMITGRFEIILNTSTDDISDRISLPELVAWKSGKYSFKLPTQCKFES